MMGTIRGCHLLQVDISISEALRPATAENVPSVDHTSTSFMSNLNKIKPHEFIRTFSHRTLEPTVEGVIEQRTVLYSNAGRWHDDKGSELNMVFSRRVDHRVIRVSPVDPDLHHLYYLNSTKHKYSTWMI